MKKKLLLALITAVVSFLYITPSTFAQLIDCSKVDAPFKTLCEATTGDVAGIIAAAITFIFVLAVIIAVFYLLWGALRWIYSGGDKAAIEAARGQIIAAIVGLVILFLGFLIFNIVLGFFNITVNSINEFPKIPLP